MYSYHWSRELGYPIFADSAHKPIYQVVFVSHKRCTSLNCTLDSNIRYTNYQGRINPFPDLTDGGVWTLNRSYIKRQNIFKDYVFDWSDSLVVAMYSQCDELASKDMGCCMNYMLDFQKEYADAVNAYQNLYYSVNGGVNPYRVQADSVESYYCLDDDGDEILNWNDSGSYESRSYNSMKINITTFKRLYEQLTTSTQNPQRIALPKVLAKGRSIQIENLNGQTAIVILDVQGRVMKSVPATSANMNIPIPYTGRYFVKIGNSITAIDVK